MRFRALLLGLCAVCAGQAHAQSDPAEAARAAARMLEEAGVATTSGMDFDPVEGHRYLRFSYANSTEAILEAIARIEKLL